MVLRVSVDDGASYSRVFTGVIKIPREGPPYPGTAGTVQIDCRSRDEILLNKRLSTPLTTFRSLHDQGATETQIMESFLGAAGLSGGDYVLDPGLFVVPWAWLDDESPVEDIWQLAAACGGRFYCDQDGMFRYENMTHWLLPPHDTSQEALDMSGYGQMEGPVYNDRELFSGVTVVASPRDLLEKGTLWAADEVVVVPAGGTTTVVAKLRQPAYAFDAPSYTAVTGGSRNMDSSISIAANYFAQRVELTVSNSNPTLSANLVALELVGVPVSGGPSQEETRESSHAFWNNYSVARPGRNRLLRSNPYIQTAAQASTLAEFLRDRYQLPRLTWRLRNVPGDPFRRLGDRVTVGNVQAMSSSREAFITAIDWRLSERGFVQDLELLDATGLYAYDDYFFVGTNRLGSGAGADNARIFY
jgi:hypothetical protein